MMKDFFTFKMEILEASIKDNKKSSRVVFSILLLNLLLGAWNAYNIYNGSGIWVSAVGVGVSWTCCLYVFMSLMEYRSDIKFDKEHLNRLKEMHESDTMKGAVDQYKSATEYYEKLMSQLVKKDQPEKPEAAVESDGEVQCANVSSSNCH